MALESWAQVPYCFFIPSSEINRNWSLAKGRGMPARAAVSLAKGLSQKKSPDCDLHSPTGDVGRGSETFPYPASACSRSVLRAMGRED